jgi:hypothetical protein
MSNDVLVDANAMSLSDDVSGESDFGLWSSEGGELGSPFSWMDESSEDDLDYFVVLDLATAESPLRSAHREAPVTSIGANIGDLQRRKNMGVSKQSVGESSRGVRRDRRMGMERSRLQSGPQLDQGAHRVLLASTSGSCIGEGVLWDIFEGEELRLMLFNFRQAGLIPKEDPM